MNVALIGATGRTGRLVLAELMHRGHTVTVLVRDPAKLGDTDPDSGVRVVVGSSTDPAAITDVLTGADAVISALGPTAKEADLHTRTAQFLVERMPAQGVTRFIGISGAGIDVPGDQKGTKDRVISAVIRGVGGAIAKDKPAEYRVLADSDLTWTLVRPPRLLDTPATARIGHDAHTPDHWSIPRSDLATFLVDVLENDLYPRQAPFVWAK
jgi:putative NADH-flavin reductase